MSADEESRVVLQLREDEAWSIFLRPDFDERRYVAALLQDEGGAGRVQLAHEQLGAMSDRVEGLVRAASRERADDLFAAAVTVSEVGAAVERVRLRAEALRFDVHRLRTDAVRQPQSQLRAADTALHNALHALAALRQVKDAQRLRADGLAGLRPLSRMADSSVPTVAQWAREAQASLTAAIDAETAQLHESARKADVALASESLARLMRLDAHDQALAGLAEAFALAPSAVLQAALGRRSAGEPLRGPLGAWADAVHAHAVQIGTLADAVHAVARAPRLLSSSPAPPLSMEAYFGACWASAAKLLRPRMASSEDDAAEFPRIAAWMVQLQDRLAAGSSPAAAAAAAPFVLDASREPLAPLQLSYLRMLSTRWDVAAAKAAPLTRPLPKECGELLRGAAVELERCAADPVLRGDVLGVFLTALESLLRRTVADARPAGFGSLGAQALNPDTLANIGLYNGLCALEAALAASAGLLREPACAQFLGKLRRFQRDSFIDPLLLGAKEADVLEDLLHAGRMGQPNLRWNEEMGGEKKNGIEKEKKLKEHGKEKEKEKEKEKGGGGGGAWNRLAEVVKLGVGNAEYEKVEEVEASEPSPYLRTLEGLLVFLRDRVLLRLEPSAALLEGRGKLAEKLLVRFVLCISLKRPRSPLGALRLAADMGQMELLVAMLAPPQTLTAAYPAWRAYKSLLFRAPAELLEAKERSRLPLPWLAHALIVHAPRELPFPHELMRWNIETYAAYLDALGDNVAPFVRLLERCLANYSETVDLRGDTRYSEVYPLLGLLCKQLEEPSDSRH